MLCVLIQPYGGSFKKNIRDQPKEFLTKDKEEETMFRRKISEGGGGGRYFWKIFYFRNGRENAKQDKND